MTDIRRYDDILLMVMPISRDNSLGQRDAEHKAAESLVAEALGDDVTIGHQQSGAPYLIGSDLFISISHSRHYAAISLSPSPGIGVDIEESRSQLRKVAPRVLSESELAAYGHSDDMLLQAWTLKEALYKAALTPGLDFRRDIGLPIPATSTTATVCGKSFEVIAILTRPDYTLSLVRSN